MQRGTLAIVVDHESTQCATGVAHAEAYPELHANLLYQNLAEQLTAIEDKIAHGRGFFNDSVKEYNVHTASFPSPLSPAIHLGADRLLVMARGRVSPPVPTSRATVEMIGQWMSGLWGPQEQALADAGA